MATTRTFVPNRTVDDAFVAILEFDNGSSARSRRRALGSAARTPTPFRCTRRGDVALQPGAPQSPRVPRCVGAFGRSGSRDLLVTDMKHPVFRQLLASGPHHRLRAHVHRDAGGVPRAVSRGEDFHPNFDDGLAVQRVLDGLQRSVKTGQWTTIDVSPGGSAHGLTPNL